MKLDLLNRTVTAIALVALAITLGIWLTRAPLTAAPVKTSPEPTLAPLPVRPTIIEVPIEVEIVDMIESPTTKPADPEPVRPTHRRRLFHRR